ncbi:tRNA (adenine22-N1)-methyltransferase [Hathewaya proteolytica DSM 3090]|uniref:tRNA (Adenine22-N1)-methyltransferase n=1 Tax=Hathewaya proteolytica DSM 3090 TaxID=1121331 RepID=A0A1M6JEB1_9CLOT|nr:class I SAM-dependent methyltransferase [Hathewaya proteolytica]SHJ45028.1 tRNA (adenine22-N1)-methyltransferase [Hathewaya proteolytica DSM 3090]
MDLSKRLSCIVSMVEPVKTIADIGTDHGYIPIHLIENSLCEFAIATDINKGPLEKAKKNIMRAQLMDKIQLRLGSGLDIIEIREVQSAVISGMGGDLTRDIILKNIDVFKNMDYIIVQPAQNVDVFRKFIYETGFHIMDEKLCFEDGKFYETIKLCYDETPVDKPTIFYEISQLLYIRKEPILKEYMEYMIEKYNRIINSFNTNSCNVIKRRSELEQKVVEIKQLLNNM